MALAATVLHFGAAGCSDDSDFGTDPGSDDTPLLDDTALLSVSPQGGSTNVDPGSAISMEFSGPMQDGMEMYAAMHEGDVTGPEVDGDAHGPDMGGDWATDDMMMGGGMMGGHPHTGEGWEHANGSFGMVFGFTTAP